MFWDSLLLRPLHDSGTVPAFCSGTNPAHGSDTDPWDPAVCTGLALAEASAELRRRLTLARPSRSPPKGGSGGLAHRGVSGVPVVGQWGVSRGLDLAHKGVSGRADHRGVSGVFKDGSSGPDPALSLEDLHQQGEIGSCALQLAILEQTHTITTLQQTVLKQLDEMRCTGDAADTADGGAAAYDTAGADGGDSAADVGSDSVLRVADVIVNQLTYTGSRFSPLLLILAWA